MQAAPAPPCSSSSTSSPPIAMAQAERSRLSVLMFPWLAHGHITPYLELARRLTSQRRCLGLDVVVHLVSTPVNLAAVARRVEDNDGGGVRLVELNLPELPGLPPALHTTKNLPPRLMPALKRACDLAAPAFGAILDELRPDVLLYDFLQPWAPLEAASRGVAAVHFNTCSAATTALFLHGLKAGGAAFPFAAVSLGGADEDAKYTALVNCGNENGGDLVPEGNRFPLSLERSSEFVAVKTCADIERKYIDYLSRLAGKEIIPCGPLLVDSADAGGEPEAGRVLRWLDGKEPGSVVLVSFGSEYFMSEHQIEQMARGLELSSACFVWVVRSPQSAGEDHGGAAPAPASALPRGFPPADRGLVVEGWAPQRRVLAHPSCGAFVTHCGWSSVVEAMAAAVPMVALPLHIDQPLNANLAAELGAAVRVRQGQFGEFAGEDVARAVREVMHGEKSGAARRRATELQEVVARNDGDGELIAALLHRMARLCGKAQWAEEAQVAHAAVPN